MKELNGKKKTLVLMGCIGALLVGANIAKADFTFGEPVNLGPTVNSAYIDGISDMSSDGLELYLESNRPGGQGEIDIWITKRATVDDLWEPPVNLGAPVNGSHSAWGPCIARDGLTLYFSSGQPGGAGNADIYVTRRATTEDPWEEPVNLGPIVNGPVWDHCPSISEDGLTLIFGSNREKIGTSYSDLCYIYVTTRPTINDPWEEPIRLGSAINPGLAYDSDYASISEDGLSLYFRLWSSGGTALWVATRTSVTDTWNRTINLGLDGVSPRFSADGSTMYFSSRSYGGYGDADLFQVSVGPVVDLNSDRIVDASDMCIILDHWGENYPLCDIGPMPWGDGVVDVQDLIVLAEHLFEEFPSAQ